jgi:hypothetical protein
MVSSLVGFGCGVLCCILSPKVVFHMHLLSVLAVDYNPCWPLRQRFFPKTGKPQPLHQLVHTNLYSFINIEY